jgi:hypothetical protein
VTAVFAALLPDFGRSVREASFMFWETLWPLVLGFGLSGAVQAFVVGEQGRWPTDRPASLIADSVTTLHVVVTKSESRETAGRGND